MATYFDSSLSLSPGASTMSTMTLCSNVDHGRERTAERNHLLAFCCAASRHTTLSRIHRKMAKYTLFLTLCSIYASAALSVQLDSAGGKAILLQNSRQLIQSDSQAKVDGLETFSNMFARIMGGSIDLKAEDILHHCKYPTLPQSRSELKGTPLNDFLEEHGFKSLQ